MSSRTESVFAILIVEDEFLIMDDISAHMRGAGHDVVEANCGEEALRQLDGRRHFDVLFTDIRLGGEIDGWEVAEKCREKLPTVSVVYASGNPNKPERPVKGSRYFSKPYHPGDIERACVELHGSA